MNGREAVNALERQSIDVLLMDLQMPEMDGYVSKPIDAVELFGVIENVTRQASRLGKASSLLRIAKTGLQA